MTAPEDPYEDIAERMTRLGLDVTPEDLRRVLVAYPVATPLAELEERHREATRPRNRAERRHGR